MTRLPAVFEPLDQAADAVIANSGHGGIPVKHQISAALADGVGYLGNAVSVMHSDLAEAGYGPEVCDVIWQARMALSSAGRACGEAERTLLGLLNMKVGDLAMSGRKAPHQSELNGGH